MRLLLVMGSHASILLALSCGKVKVGKSVDHKNFIELMEFSRLFPNFIVMKISFALAFDAGFLVGKVPHSLITTLDFCDSAGIS
jgi:hypothetical protein